MKRIAVAALAALLGLASEAQASTRDNLAFPPPYRGAQLAVGAPAPAAHRHGRRRGAKRQEPPQAPIKVAERKIGALEQELAEMRRELAEVRERIGRPAWDGIPIPFVSIGRPRPQAEEAPSLPDLRGPLSAPAAPGPQPAATLGPLEELDRATAYLARTATPGFTMLRQGIAVALGRLHPEFRLKLADAVRRARAAGLARAGVFSAYRPPAFGVGGFSDKFNSLHSYGLAADVTGIGSPGSSAARLWKRIVDSSGLFLPYGPNNRAEFNHTQLVPTRMAPAFLRRTITASGPRDLRGMWLASGVRADVPAESPISSALLHQ